MKKIALLSALALPLAFAACENEDFVTVETDTPSVGQVAVTGAKLAGRGMSITLNEADTRFDAAGNWVIGEKAGVAWVTTMMDHNNINSPLSYDKILGFEQTGIDGATYSGLSEAEKANYFKCAAANQVSGSVSFWAFYFEDAEGTGLATRTSSTEDYNEGKYYQATWPVNAYQAEDGKFYYPAPVAGISQPQLANWPNSLVGITDYKLYANNKFEYTGNGFDFDGDIYEGAYFAYWPFKKQGKIEEKTVELANVQNSADALTYFSNAAFEISALDTIVATDDLEKRIDKPFSLKRIANGIGITTKFVSDGDLSELKIGGVELATKTATFYTEATLQPQKLPTAVWDNDGKVYSSGKTLAKMTKANLIGDEKAIKMKDAKANLKTEVEVDMPVTATNQIVLLTFPTAKAVTTRNISFTIPAYTLDENGKPVEDGKFVIGYKDGENLSDAQLANNAAIVKLSNLMSTTGWYQETTGKYLKLSDILANPVNLNLSLDIADYIKEVYQVSNAEEWNAAVANINKLGLKNATINTTGAITFDETELPAFPESANLTVSGENTITIDGEDATINADVTFANKTGVVSILVKYGKKLNIAEGATVKLANVATTATEPGIEVDGVLNVNGTITSDAATDAAAKNFVAVHNHNNSLLGVMNLGAKGVVEKVKLVNNNKIYIEEGAENSLATPTTTSTGKIYATLTSAATQDVVTNILATPATDVTFDNATVANGTLKKNVTYNTGGETSFKTIEGDGAKIEITDGTLTFVKGASTTTALGDITIRSGAALVDKSENADVTVGTIYNGGKITVANSTKLNTTEVQGGTTDCLGDGKIIQGN